jgi:hypothetical protein
MAACSAPKLDTAGWFCKTPPVKQSIVTLDTAGVLTPEIRSAVAIAQKARAFALAVG